MALKANYLPSVDSERKIYTMLEADVSVIYYKDWKEDLRKAVPWKYWDYETFYHD